MGDAWDKSMSDTILLALSDFSLSSLFFTDSSYDVVSPSGKDSFAHFEFS